MDLKGLGAVFRAIYLPVVGEEKPLIASKSLKEATRRLEQEASLLEQDAHVQCGMKINGLDDALRRVVEDM